MRTLNLGILAHVDAGKTSLTERLLFAGGAIRKVGSVDAGDTQTDSLDQERQRGITIRAAVASFRLNELSVNLIDTPGHPDFIAEVERVLNVLDGAIIVISAVEGVQAQTRVLMRSLQRLKLPTLVFVNKIDRRGARYEVLEEIQRRLSIPALPMGEPERLGAPDATVTPYSLGDPSFRTRLAEALSENDDALLAAYLEDPGSIGRDRLRSALRHQVAEGLVHPVFWGSAVTGAGAEALTEALAELLPTAPDDLDTPLSATAFKVERGAGGEKIAYVRMFSGALESRQRVDLHGLEQKVTSLRVFSPGGVQQSARVRAGQIALVGGLSDVRIGDTLGICPSRASARHFPPPTLEAVVAPKSLGETAALYAALSQLAEQDPLINLRHDDVRQQVAISLYGEVQKEVIQETLRTDFGLEVEFLTTTTICVEQPIGVGQALEEAPDPFVATVGLRVEPAPPGAGVVFDLEIELGSTPLPFIKAVEASVRETLTQGGLHGWNVIDCRVTMTHAIRYRKWATSTPADHRNLTPLVLMQALKAAGTRVLEPINRFQLEAPANALSVLLPALSRLQATWSSPHLDGDTLHLEGEIPAARTHDLQQQLPSLTHGEGLLEVTFDHYGPAAGPPPTRPRTGRNPLNRTEYLLGLTARV